MGWRSLFLRQAFDLIEFCSADRTQEHFIVPAASSAFLSFSMNGDKFVFGHVKLLLCLDLNSARSGT